MCVLQDETQTNGSLLSQLLMLLLSVDSSLHYRASRLLQIVCSAYRCFHDFDLIKLIISWILSVFVNQSILCLFTTETKLSDVFRLRDEFSLENFNTFLFLIVVCHDIV